MAEGAEAGAEVAPEAASAAGKGAGDVAGVAAGDAASAGATGIAGSASPFALDSPITAGSFDYLNAAAPAAGDAAGAAGNIAPGAGFITSDASLGTAGAAPDPFGAGSTALPGSNAAGQPLASGGTTALAGSGASIDPAASSALSAPAGQSATSVAPAASSAAGTAPADATSSWADKLTNGLTKSVTSNPLGLALGAAGLGYNILQGQKQTANQGALSQQAQQAGANNTALTNAGVAQVTANQGNAAPLLAQGEALTQPLTTGQLPPQYTQQIDQAINDEKTAAISAAAKNGQPTDPSKNTALAQQLAQIDNQRAGMTTQVANTLFGAGSGLIGTATGVGNQSAASLLSGGQNAAGLSGQLYSTLTGIDTQQSQATAKAIAALAQSLNSTGTNTTQKAA